MKKAVSTLEAHLGYWLRYVSNHVSQSFARKLAARGMSVAEWVALRALYDGALAPSELAERMGMTRGAITKLADKLIARNYAARALGTADRRTQTLALTEEGRALVPDLAALADQNDKDFFGHLSRAEKTALEETLKDIVRRHALKSVPVD